MLKKGKAGEKLVNVKPFIFDYSFHKVGNDLEGSLVLASGNTNTLNPQMLLNLFAEGENVSVEGAFILRSEILTENGNLFE